MTSSQANSLNHLHQMQTQVTENKKGMTSSQANSLNHLQIQTQNMKSQKIKKE